MEKITLTPLPNEIIVNHGAEIGAVDIFSYSADDTPSKDLGSLYIIGHRSDDSANMGYIVSLIAALARREYYAQHALPPREAFARTLRKANEVVEEFFRAGEAKLSVGIVAIAGGQVMVSKLDKFKILLARDGQVIDILSNVLLFSKEHTERRRFSSIIHGSVQAGDRILAFVPTRTVATRERNLKSWLLNLPQNEFAQRLSEVGQQHASFATAMIHIDIAQTSEPALAPAPQPRELIPPSPTILPESPPSPSPLLASRQTATTHHHSEPLAWLPRQHQRVAPSIAQPAAMIPVPADTEAPRLIPTEFALGTRRTVLSRFLNRIRIVRFDARGKAIALAALAVVAVGLVLGAKSFFLTDPQKEETRRALEALRADISEARAKNAQGFPVEARALLSRALVRVVDLSGYDDDTRAALTDEITETLDVIDRAEPTTPTLVASPAPDTEHITLASWSSSSQALWVGGRTDEGTVWAATLRNGTAIGRITLGTAGEAPLLIGWKDSVIVLDPGTRILTRMVGSDALSYVIPVQETILDVAEFGDNLYVLTDKTILKISDLDTMKPITKRWLADDTQLAPQAARLIVDGSIRLMSRDGTLTTYYKGTKTATVVAPLTLSGVWRLLPWSDGKVAVASGNARRIYVIDPKSGSLIKTLKVDSLIPFTYIAPGPGNSALLITEEGKLWQVR